MEQLTNLPPKKKILNNNILFFLKLAPQSPVGAKAPQGPPRTVSFLSKGTAPKNPLQRDPPRGTAQTLGGLCHQALSHP